MDDIDKAQVQSDLLLEKAVENSRKTITRIHPTVFCHYCAEELSPGQLFCDIGCRDDYAWMKRLNK